LHLGGNIFDGTLPRQWSGLRFALDDRFRDLMDPSPSEANALMALKAQQRGGALSDWSTRRRKCDWSGVTCNTAGEVVELPYDSRLCCCYSGDCGQKGCATLNCLLLCYSCLVLKPLVSLSGLVLEPMCPQINELCAKFRYSCEKLFLSLWCPSLARFQSSSSSERRFGA